MNIKIDENKIRETERENFRILKEKENLKREFPNSDDFLLTSNFIFKEYKNCGDSGDLLLAINKNNSDEQYIIKHAYYDCACNEYMYSKIGNKMGIKIVPVKLFYVNSNKELFKSDFVCGIEYLKKAQIISYKDLENNKKSIINFNDYYRFL